MAFWCGFLGCLLAHVKPAPCVVASAARSEAFCAQAIVRCDFCCHYNRLMLFNCGCTIACASCRVWRCLLSVAILRRVCSHRLVVAARHRSHFNVFDAFEMRSMRLDLREHALLLLLASRPLFLLAGAFAFMCHTMSIASASGARLPHTYQYVDLTVSVVVYG